MILKLKRAGADVRLVLCTNGKNEDEYRYVATRMKEFSMAVKSLDLHTKDIQYLRAAEGHMRSAKTRLGQQISKLIEEYRPNWIFVPYLLDINNDHLTTNYILADCLEENEEMTIAMYEVWTPILYPNFYLNITDVFSQKCAAIQCYDTQEQQYAILDRCRALCKLRASLLGKRQYQYVEAFKYFSAPEYKRITNALIKP